MSENSAARNRRRGSQQSKSSDLDGKNEDVEAAVDESDKTEKENVKRVSSPADFSFISIITLVGVSVLFAKYMDGRLPKPLTVSDIPGNPNSFIEERARSDLHTLTSVGVRVSGSSATDKDTVDNFSKIIDAIIDNKTNIHNIEYDVQLPTGAFFMDSDEGHTSSYAKIRNVVVKLEAADPSLRRNSSFLVNCHFDTKPGSPGATDNMISCAVMLEALRVLSHNDSPFPNSIIFLFNGAEELGLQGAHAFVEGQVDGQATDDKGHKWSKNVKAFMNLEGAGAGGREILFQTGPGNSWVLRTYSSVVPYPYTTVLGEEAFQRNLVPSDTDFRIFRDFKNIPGLDMAFIKNGWVYHTKWDKLTEIPPGSIQHMGENALELLKEFGKINLQVEDTEGKLVFFDVLGGFVIRYSEVVGIIINVIVSLASLIFIYWREIHKKMKILEIVWLPVATIISWGLGLAAAVLVGLFLNGCGYYKPFYSYPSLSFVVFGVPAILAQTISFSFAFKGSEEKTWLAGKVTVAILTIAMTFISRAAYVFMVISLFSVVGWFLARWLNRGWPRAILIWYLAIGEFVPFLLFSYLLITLADIFVPIMGRSGSETNANLFFGVIIAAVISILLFNGLTSIFVSYRKGILITCFFLSFFLLNPMIVFGFIGKIPYQEKTPMRLNIVELDRTWYQPDLVTASKTEAGYWFWTLDSNTDDFMSTFAKTVPSINNIQDVKIDSKTCEDLYCAQPFLWPTSEIIKKTHWIPIDSPTDGHFDEKKDLVQFTYENGTSGVNSRNFTFTFSGPTQLTIVLSPNANYKLSSWSLTTDIPPSGVEWKGRPTYFIYHSKGQEEKDFNFTCGFTSTGNSVDGPVLDMQLGGFFLYEEGMGMKGEEFNNFISLFPSWTNVMSWTTVLKIYTIY